MKFFLHLAAAQNFDTVERTADDSRTTQKLFVDGSAIFETLLEVIEINNAVDRLEFDIVEAALGQTTDEGHLTAFKSRTNATAGAGFLTLVAFAGSLAVAGAFAAAKSFTAVFRAGIGF